MARTKVSRIPGRKKVSDKYLLYLYKRGWFLEQIRKKYIIGIERLQRITRAYDAQQKAKAIA